MSHQQPSKATKDITVPSVSGKEAGKSIRAINSTENVSINQFSPDASVVAGQCASSSIVAASTAAVVKTLETTISSGSSSLTPNSSSKAPSPNITTNVAVSQMSSSDTSDDVSSVTPNKHESPSSVASETTEKGAVNTNDVNTPTVVPLSGGETSSSTQGYTTVEGVRTVTPSTPSSAPRRSSRARRINSRFDFDEVDENIKKFVARIAAPDSHSILQSPELAFHSPAPPPPPPPASLPSKTSAEQTGEPKVNSKRPQKKTVKRLQAVVEIEKCKKGTIAAFTSNKSKVFKTSKQDTLHTKAKSSSLEAFGSDSDDDLPLAHFTASNASAAAVEKPVLTPIVSKSKILNSKGAGSLPSKYSIKTIHNPELSSAPISIVCIDDPEEEEEGEEEELAQSLQKKVKKKISNENIQAKKRKGGLTSIPSKMNGTGGMKVSKKLAPTKTSKVQKPPKKFELEKLKNKLNASQASTGKLLKIVNLKVVPSSLPDLSSNNILRKFIAKNADNAACDKIPDQLERASSAVPDQVSVAEPETEAQGSSQKVFLKALPQPKSENISSKYDDLKALLHADEPPLSPEWLQEKHRRPESLPIKDEHKPCNSSSLGTDASNVECSHSETQGSSRTKSASNVASVETSPAGNKNLSDSSGLGLKTETVGMANLSKRPSSDLSSSNSKKVKHERKAEKVVSNAENNAKDSDFTNFVYKPATDSCKESVGCNSSFIKVDPCERKPDIAMIRDTRMQNENGEQEKEAKFHLSSILQNDKISGSIKPCSPSYSPVSGSSGSAKSTSKSTTVRNRTESPSDARFAKRIKMSPVDSKEDVKPDLLMTKIIEGTGVESKPVLPSFKPSIDCSSPEKLSDDKQDSCASGDRAFKEEPKKSSDHLLSSPSPTDSPVCGYKTSRNDTAEQMFENEHGDSHLQNKDKASNDELNSSLNVQKHSLCNDSENNVVYDQKRLSGGDVKKASSVEKCSSINVSKGSPRNEKKDDQSFLVSSKDSSCSDRKGSSQNDTNDADSSRDDKKGSSRSERKDSSRNGRHSSNHKSSHSSRGDKYHSERSSSRSSNSSRNSDRKAERSSHKPRHESSRSRDQKSSRKESDGKRDYDPRDKSEKNRRRRSDDKKRDYYEKRNKITDASEIRVVENLGTIKAPFTAEVPHEIIGTCERDHSHEIKTETTSPNVSATVPLTSSQVDDDDKLLVSERLAPSAPFSIRDKINSITEMHSSKPVAIMRQDSPSASSGNQCADVKLNVQGTGSDGAKSSPSAITEDCHGVSSPCYSHHAGIRMKTENSVDESKISSLSICSANVSQVQYKTSMNSPSNFTGGSASEISLEETVTTPLEAKHTSVTTATDTAAPPINIAALLNLCRANIPNATRSKFPLKQEGTDSETSHLTALVAGTSLSTPIANPGNNSSAKPHEVLSSTDSLVELISSNYVSKEECKFISTGVGVTINSQPKESNFEEGEDKTEKRLCELNDGESDPSPNLSSVSNQAPHGHLCVRSEDFRFEKKSCSQVKDDCDSKEGSTAVDIMNVGGNILAGVSSTSVELKGLPLPSVEETPEEKEKRVEKERQIAIEKELRNKTVVEERLKSFVHLSENLYLIDRKKSKQSKEVRRMVCDCFLTKEEISRGEKGCGEDCLNRLLMIECGWRCPLGDACLNRQFQRCDYGPIEVFNAEEKGCGVRATGVISPGTFIMEYVGEVFDQREFRRRRKDYGKDGTAHFYFMALRADQFIDATRKGNISRFVNHSCDPNAETQKWTVNGELRIGFFATKYIAVGEEINFDYRMERYGREPQKCYCGTAVCRGWLGEPPDEKTKEEKEEERRKLASTDKRKKDDKKHFDDELLEDVCELGRVGLRNKRDTLLLSRVMVRAETDAVRVQLLALLCAASANTPCLRLFMDYHGLSLLWSWMADLNTALHHAPLKLQILKTLDILPITNRTQVSDSRVLEMVEKWSKQLPPPPTAATDGASDQSGALASDASKSSDGCGFEETDESSQQSSDDNSKQSPDDVKQSAGENTKQASDDSKRSPDDNIKQMLSPDDNSSDSNSSAVKSKPTGASQAPTSEGTSSSVFSRDEDAELRKVQLEMVELALKLLERWQVLKEEFRIPKKQRVELMKEHEREVEAGYRRYLNTERGRRETRDSRYGRSSYDSRRSKMHLLDSHDKNSWPNNDAISIMMNSEEFAGLSKEERREKFAQKVAQVDEQRRVQEGMWSVHVERCARIGLDPYRSPIVDPSGQYYWDSGNSTWVPLTPETAYAAGMLSPAVAQQHGMAATVAAGFCMPGVDQPVPYDPHTPPVLNGEVLPPLVITIKLPPHWHIARDQLNRVYFYHNRSRQTQWEIPTNETKTSIQISDSESESSSSSSDSEEEFSSDEDEGNDDEVALATSTSAAEDAEVAVEGKIIRRQRGRKKHSEALVQQRVISPIRELDREQARRERREAKERAKHEARKERHFLDQQLVPNDEDVDDEVEGNADDLLISRVVHHPGRDKVKTKSKERAATAIADNSERARKIKDLFRSRMATFIVSVLNPYRRADCKQGRINTTEDFKYLARKLTHFVMVKELKQLPSIEDLDCSESVKHKTKDFVRKYMAKYGTSFKRDPLDTKEY